MSESDINFYCFFTEIIGHTKATKLQHNEHIVCSILFIDYLTKFSSILEFLSYLDISLEIESFTFESVWDCATSLKLTKTSTSMNVILLLLQEHMWRVPVIEKLSAEHIMKDHYFVLCSNIDRAIKQAFNLLLSLVVEIKRERQGRKAID